MPPGLTLAAALAVSFSQGSAAGAQIPDDEPGMEFVYIPSTPHREQNVIYANGRIDQGATERLIQKLDSIRGAEYIRWISFGSTGGDLFEAMRLGRAIRSRGLRTTITEEGCSDGVMNAAHCGDVVLRQGRCLSACAYAFLGGMEREMAAWDQAVFLSRGSAPQQSNYLLETAEGGQALLGFHQFAGDDPQFAILNDATVRAVLNITNAQAQYAAAELATYIQDMGVDLGILRLASGEQASGMRFPTIAELRTLRVVGRIAFQEFRLVPDGEGVAAVARTDAVGAEIEQIAFVCRDLPGPPATRRVALVYSRPKVRRGRHWATIGPNPTVAEVSGLPGLQSRLASEPVEELDFSGVPHDADGIPVPEAEDRLRMTGGPPTMLEGWAITVDRASIGFGARQIRQYADANWEHIEAYPTAAEFEALLAGRTWSFLFEAPTASALTEIPPVRLATEGPRHIRAALRGCMAPA